MLGFFKSKPFHDPQLGAFLRSRGRWRGSLELGAAAGAGASVPLVLSGSRAEPDPQVLSAAKTLTTQIASWRTVMEEALFEHYRPYADEPDREALADSEQAIPVISEPSQVWSHVSLEYVSVAPTGAELSVELGYSAAWDEEHTLGAVFQSGNLIELCGSVLPP